MEDWMAHGGKTRTGRAFGQTARRSTRNGSANFDAVPPASPSAALSAARALWGPYGSGCRIIGGQD